MELLAGGVDMVGPLIEMSEGLQSGALWST